MKLRIKLLIFSIVGFMLFIGWYCGIVLGDYDLAHLFGLGSILFLFFLFIWVFGLIVGAIKKAGEDVYVTPKSFLKKCVECGREIPVAALECQYCGSKQPL